MPLLKLISSDDVEMEIESEVMNCSGTIKTMLVDCGIVAAGHQSKTLTSTSASHAVKSKSAIDVPLPNVTAATLEKIIEWATHHFRVNKAIERRARAAAKAAAANTGYASTMANMAANFIPNFPVNTVNVTSHTKPVNSNTNSNTNSIASSVDMDVETAVYDDDDYDDVAANGATNIDGDGDGADDDGDYDDIDIDDYLMGAATNRVIVADQYNDEQSQTADNAIDNVPKWDLAFLNLDQAAIFEILLAANYLDIQLLLEYSCKCVARMIKGKTAEEIRALFNIKNDMTEEEKAAIQAELMGII